MLPEALAGCWIPLPIGDARSLEAAVDTLAGCGVRGVAACASGGQAGEYADLSEREWNSALGRLTKAAGPGHLIGVGHADAQVSLDRAQRAAEHEPLALIAPLPEDEHADQIEGWVAELSAMAPECGLILAETPRGPRCSPEQLRRLAGAAPTLAGLALSHRGEDGLEDLRGFEQELALFVPSAEFATGFRHGAVACISEYGCLSPAGAALWYEQAQRDMRAALRFERRWQRFAEDRLRPLQARFELDQAAVDRALAFAGGWWAGPLAGRGRAVCLPKDLAQGLGQQAQDAGLLEL